MGIQNIKGTGLDFIYRWQAWERCHKACCQLQTADAGVMAEGLKTLTSFAEFGRLCETFVYDIVQSAKESPQAQREDYQAMLSIVELNLERSITALKESLRSSSNLKQKRAGSVDALASVVEAFLDGYDAIKRRRIAGRIYRDLVAQRISMERAANELKRLNARQKGGWFRPGG